MYIKSFETPKVRSFLGAQVLVAVLLWVLGYVRVQVLEFHLIMEEGHGGSWCLRLDNQGAKTIWW